MTLLPLGTPAYYLTTYSGPTSALSQQFEDSLDGIGVGEWKDMSSNSGHRKAPWIIAYIAVQNKNGEDKGLTIIWPYMLCVAFEPRSKQARERKSLDYVPELAGQLQPSPPPPMPPRCHGRDVLANVEMNDYMEKLRASPFHKRACSSPSNTLKMLRLGRKERDPDMKAVAREVGTYVDTIAKEREKERERIRKERDNANSPKIGIGHQSTGSTGGTSAAAGPSSPRAQPLEPPQCLVPPHPSQHFYPSPPQSNPPAGVTSDVPTSPDVASNPAIESHTPPISVLPNSDAAPPASSSSSFDPFGNLDSTWSQPPANDEFMELGMDFNMNIADHGMDSFDDTITDDDFNFFDHPSTNSMPKVAHGLPVKIEQGQTPTPLGAEMTGSPQVLGVSHLEGQSPWPTGSLGEGFTSRSMHTHDVVSFTPDLLPPSPGMTPTSRSMPSTPNVRLENNVSKNVCRLGRSIFDPIPFAHSHRITDGKYVMGKFALPSPPDEEDRTNPMFFPVRRKDGWKVKYNAATDPRIGVVEKLIGFRRKRLEQGLRDIKVSLSWAKEHDDWESAYEGWNGGEDVGMNDASEDEEPDQDSPMVSRPSTPPPSYLPLGPTLLHTHFHHSLLLPLCSPLRPPGAAVAPTTIASTVTPANVPTPVSPAAMIGAASEKSKSLEAAALRIATEVVENCVWADAWNSNAGSTAIKADNKVWQTDVKAVAYALGNIQGLHSGIELGKFFLHEGDAPLEELEPPMLSIGKSDAVIQVLPTALRFWEKLGLGPRGGKKNVTAFVLFEDSGEGRQTQVEAWLRSVSATYTVSSQFGI
jgi:mediator of RNA polymerase II transcription subunit 13